MRNARLAKISVAVVMLVFLLIGGIFIAPGFFKETVVKKKPLAFGKLRSSANRTEGSAQSASVASAEPSFEYSWTGGPWPDFPGELAVYRRRSGELTLVQAKLWAAKFGLSRPSTEPLETGAAKPQRAPAVEQIEPAPGRVEAEVSPLRAERESFAFYDQESGKRLYLYIGAGRFDYHDEKVSEDIDRQPNDGLSEKVAEKFATDWLGDKGLLPADRTGPFFGAGGVVSASVVNPDGAAPAVSEPQITRSPYFEVNFGRRLGTYDLVEQDGEVNQYVISVTVGPNGLILGASGEIPLPLEASDYPLIDPVTAFAEVKKGTHGGTQALGVPEPLLATAPQVLVPQRITLEVDQVKLAYLAAPSDDGTVLYQPVYVFNGTTPRFYQVAVPAIERTQLQD